MIEIVGYRASWSDEFQEIAAWLRSGLADLALRIDHIGSTSVPQLCAKDVIDIQVTVEKLGNGNGVALHTLGFVRHPEVNADHVPPGTLGPKTTGQSPCSCSPAGTDE